MELVSSVFKHGGSIPAFFTCDGENVSPPLRIGNVPEGTAGLVLIMEDPDVPKSIRKDGMWDHWVVWNMPPKTKGIGEGQTPPGRVGVNTGGENAYGGPCPPDGEHRYFFRLYAVDELLELPETATKADVLSAIKGHILEEAELMGTYNRS